MRYIISLSLASLLPLSAAAEVPRVVTDIPPVGALVAQVMGDLGAPVVLLDRGADPHAFQMRPSQAGDLAAAQAVIWVGPRMTPWLERALAGNTALDLQLLSVPGTTLRDYATTGADDHEGHDHAAGDKAAHEGHDHAAGDKAAHEGHDHAAEDKAAHEGHDHAHDGLDPHAWLDPANAGVWLQAIATTLSDLDPANAATYAANAAKGQADLQDLDADLRAQLAPVGDFPLIVFHNAYGYFASHYGLNVVGALSDGDAASPGAAHLRDLQAQMQDRDLCLFPEANHDAKLLASLQGAPGLRIGAALDPEGSLLSPGPALYVEMMRAMATAIATCATGTATP